MPDYSRDQAGFQHQGLEQFYPFKANFHVHPDQVHQHYVDEGEGHPIVMVHGNPTWSFYYRNLALQLKDKYRVIVPDHVGCGFSQKPQNYKYRLKQHIDNLERLINSLNLDSFSMVVHDWGGMIGFGLARRMPEKVKSFVILNTCAFRLPKVNKFPLSIAACRVPVFGKFATQVLNGFGIGAAHMATVSPEFSQAEKDGLLAPYNSYRNRVAIYSFVQDIPLNPSHPSYDTLLDIERNLHLFKNHPKQIIWGKKDFCFDDHFLDEWHNFFPETREKNTLIIPGAGHYVLEDARKQVIETAQSFFDSLEL